MRNQTRLILLLGLIAIAISYFFILRYTPLCDFYGGPRNEGVRCECAGIKISVLNESIGGTATGRIANKCLGVVKSTCTVVELSTGQLTECP